MRYVKLFEDFIFESSSNKLIDQILTAAEQRVVEMVGKIEKYYIEKNMKFTDWDREMARLQIIYDMLRSIEKYTLPTDTLVYFNPRTSVKGNLEFQGLVDRDGERYDINTQAIYAGGHNIQTLHYRYITNTSLPQTNRSAVTDEYAQKIKKLTKLEKIKKEIADYQARIDKNNEDILKNAQASDEEIFNVLSLGRNEHRDWPDWSEIIRRGADKNFKDQEDFERSQAKYKADTIDFWKRINIQSKQDNNKILQREIGKLEAKMRAFIG
jgi:flagellar motor protein MotB